MPLAVCDNLSGYISLHCKSKIQRAAEVVEHEIDFKTIYQTGIGKTKNYFK